MESDKLDGHALVVGVPGKPPKGIDRDARCMAEMLGKRRFAVDVLIGEQATRAGILSGYDKLIATARPDKATVFYYAGHGFRAYVENESRSWQGLSTFDLSENSPNDFRGITSWELSIKQAQLTAKTKNVTVILDCCFASQMCRDSAVHDAVPRALPHPLRLGFAAHLLALREQYQVAFDDVNPLGNPDVVRLVACGPTDTAYPFLGADGQHRGAFTYALLEVLSEVGGARVSWAAIDHAIRSRVLRRTTVQHPRIEGPARRRLFSLDEVDAAEAVTIDTTDVENRFQLGAGRLMGVTLGDVYGVMPPGPPTYRAADAIAELRVRDVFATSAIAELDGWRNGHSALPEKAFAVLAEKIAARRAVTIDVPASARQAVAVAVAGTRTLRLAEPDEVSELAILRLRDDVLTIEDRKGPLFPVTRFPDELQGTVKNLENLGVAQSVRELEGQHGVRADDLEIEWGTIERGVMRPMPEAGGALALHDRLYVRVKSKVSEPLHVHVFNIGLRDTIKLLTDYAPAGVELTRREPELMLGRRGDGSLVGLPLGWPVGMPRETFPRIDEIVVVVTSTAASLQSLETVEHFVAPRGASSKLEDLLAGIQGGHARNTRSTEPIDGFFVKRLWYLLHPRDAVMANIPFAIDDNPLRQVAASTPAAWLVPDADAVPSGSLGAIAIRIAELVVESTRVLSADLRVDVLVCTRSMTTAAGHATWTRKLSGIKDGQRLDLDQEIVFSGPVHDFVDLYVWVSRDSEGSPELAHLLADPKLDDTAAALLVSTGDRARPWIDAIAGSAVLSRTAYELLGGAGQVIGVYRTAFLAHDEFGIGRHPVEGCHRTDELSFAILVEPGQIGS